MGKLAEKAVKEVIKLHAHHLKNPKMVTKKSMEEEMRLLKAHQKWMESK